jgi:hypothetical protein
LNCDPSSVCPLSSWDCRREHQLRGTLLMSHFTASLARQSAAWAVWNWVRPGYPGNRDCVSGGSRFGLGRVTESDLEQKEELNAEAGISVSGKDKKRGLIVTKVRQASNRDPTLPSQRSLMLSSPCHRQGPSSDMP